VTEAAVNPAFEAIFWPALPARPLRQGGSGPFSGFAHQVVCNDRL